MLFGACHEKPYNNAMHDPANWRPTATLERLKLRARLLSTVRQFFDERGYWEVDTPLMSHERVVDPHLDPFLVVDEPGAASGADSGARAPLFLQTSPEFAMKRLLAAGAGAIYQVAHVFRRGELGRWHNPEFTMIEWYRAGDTHLDQMRVVEELVLAICNVAAAQRNDPESAATAGNQKESAVRPSGDGSAPRQLPRRPFAATSYRDAFRRHAEVDVVLMPMERLVAWVHSRGLHPPPGLSNDDRDGWLNWLLAELVEPHLGCEGPEFLCDYPATQAALARVRAENPPVAERFELYWRGVELCNGYHELCDADELQRRIDLESERRIAGGLSPLPFPPRLLAAMRAGFPACSGVALGFDRLMALAICATSVREVTPFAFEDC